MSKHSMIAKLLVALVFVAIARTPAHADTVNFTQDVWEPWMIGAEGSPPQGGVAVNLAKAILEEAGVEYTMTLFPWKRSLRQAETGEMDAIFFLTKNAEREGYMTFSEPLLISPYVAFFDSSANPDFDWKDWSDLKGLRIGTTAGTNYGDAFFEAAEKYGYDLQETNSEAANFEKLKAGRVDIVITNVTLGNFVISQKENLKASIKPSNKPIDNSVFYMAFSNKSDKLSALDKINDAIKTLSANGKVDEIVAAGP